MALRVIDAANSTVSSPVSCSGDNIYTYAGNSFAPVATPTAIIVVQGTSSSSKVTRIRSIKLTGSATAAGEMKVAITRRSTAGTLGSAVLTGVTATKHVSASDAATSTVSTVGTANYTTLGTTAGVLAAGHINFTAIDTGVYVAPFEVSWGGNGIMPPVLANSGEYITVDLLGDGIPSGGTVDYTIVLEEASS